MVLVKICGITKTSDAQLAVEAGANFIGLIFAPLSKRKISQIEDARSIVETLRSCASGKQIPKDVKIVGVFQNQPMEEVAQICIDLKLDFCQLHGEEDYEDPLLLMIRPWIPHFECIKVIGVTPKDTLSTILGKCKLINGKFILLDTKLSDGRGGNGGTGKVFNWEIAKKVIQCGLQVFLAGGITPENVKEALELSPFAVDISSGVESSPGQKDPEKLSALSLILGKKIINHQKMEMEKNPIEKKQKARHRGGQRRKAKPHSKEHELTSPPSPASPPSPTSSKFKSVKSLQNVRKQNPEKIEKFPWEDEMSQFLEGKEKEMVPDKESAIQRIQSLLSQDLPAAKSKKEKKLKKLEKVDTRVDSVDVNPDKKTGLEKQSTKHDRNASKNKKKETSNEQVVDFTGQDTAGTSKKQNVKPDQRQVRERPRLRRPFYQAHSNIASLQPRIEANEVLRGAIRINRLRRKLAYVTVDGYLNDIVIIGSKDQNRALEGDKVLIEIIGEASSADFEDMKGGYEFFQETKKKNVLKIANSNEEHEEDEDEHVIHSIGRVLAVEERRPGRIYAGFLMPVGWNPGEKADKQGETRSGENQAKDKSPHNIFFRPSDKRAPLLLIALKDCPKDFGSNFEKYEDTIFVCSFDRWPDQNRFPFGKLEKVLGQVGEILVETDAIIESNSVRDVEFSAAVTSCLPTAPWSIPAEEIEKRKDLRKDCIFTIDPETARDLDDAVSCKQLENGNLLIGVHIADVSHFVKPETALDKEAFERATTTYLVQRAIPMLPGMLCENLCSLNPGVERLAFSVMWTMDQTGNILETWFGKTIIKSCIKLNYEQAQKLIDGASWEEAVGKDLDGNHSVPEVISNLKIFHRLSQAMRKKRFEEGALTINQPKLTFRLDDTNHPIFCGIYNIKDSNRLIEEFMLLANRSVAEKISQYFPESSLLRCHPPPKARSMKNFLDYTVKMGYHLKAESAGSLQESIMAIEDLESRQIFQLLAIKPMQRANYFCTGEFENRSKWKHYALNMDLYTHFTSPIRRYADVIVHRLLQASLDEESNMSGDMVNTMKIARQCNLKKEDARSAQDASSKLFLCVYLQRLEKHLQSEIILDGIVMDFGEKAFDVYIPEFALDRRVHYGDSGAVKSIISSNKDKCEVIWPKEMIDLPPFYDEEAINAPVEKLKDGFVTNYRSSSNSDIVQNFNILDHVRLRVMVKGKSPLDVAAFLLHPSHSKPFTNIHSLIEILPINAIESVLEETFIETDR